MQILTLAVGKLKSGPEFELCKRYQQRAQALARSLGLTGPDLTEIEAPKGLTGQARTQKEGALMAKALPAGGRLILLDERGTTITSADFAGLIERYRDEGAPSLALAIGGADGHCTNFAEQSVKKISFGAATWPHMLVRVMLSEQIYRAMTMLTGHPYHRE